MKKLLFSPFIFFLLFSCNSNKNRVISEDVSAFIESNSTIAYFGYVDVKSILDKAEYQSIENWDSVGHMSLIVSLEDAFEITFEMDDILDFSSYSKGVEILRKYSVEL